MKTLKILGLNVEELEQSEQRMITGGSWISYAIGYVASKIYHTPSEDKTKYGGVYLESTGSRSSIM